MSSRLANRSIVVTGAAGGLGKTVCRVLLEAGAQVTAGVYTLNDAPALREATAEHTDRLRLVEVDATSAESVDKVFMAAKDFAGELWGAVLLVGGYTGGTRLGDESDEALERMLDLNVRATWTCSRLALRRLDNAGTGGRVVTVSSAAANRGGPAHAAYSATKAAVMRLTESAASDYRRQDITVNTVQPGMIATAANKNAMPDADQSTWVTPEQVANVIAFLLSDEASGVNGAAIRVTGRG